MRHAFKEWAIVVDALTRGDQIVILRKGGISEGKAGFTVEAESFWLFPTLFHQQRESVIETAQRRYDSIAPNFPSPNSIRLEAFVRVAAWREIHNPAELEKLRAFHIWRDEVIAQRFDWGKSRSIYALVVRAFRATKAHELPMAPEYSGCKSWIDLAEDLPAEGEPVLSAGEFANRLTALRQQIDLQLTDYGTMFLEG